MMDYKAMFVPEAVQRVGDVMKILETVNDVDDARNCYEAYVDFIVATEGGSLLSAKETARSNISFGIGRFGGNTARWSRIYELFIQVMPPAPRPRPLARETCA